MVVGHVFHVHVCLTVSPPSPLPTMFHYARTFCMLTFRILPLYFLLSPQRFNRQTVYSYLLLCLFLFSCIVLVNFGSAYICTHGFVHATAFLHFLPKYNAFSIENHSPPFLFFYFCAC